MGSRPFTRASGEPAIVAGFARIQSQPADALQLLLQHNKEQPVGPKRAFPFNDKPAGDRVWSGLNTDACRLIVNLEVAGRWEPALRSLC